MIAEPFVLVRKRQAVFYMQKLQFIDDTVIERKMRIDKRKKKQIK